MGICYDPLWNLLDELNISKMEFARKIDISNATLAKLGKNEPVTLTIVDRICDEFNCDISNVLFHKENKEQIMIQGIKERDVLDLKKCVEKLANICERIQEYNPNVYIHANSNRLELYGDKNNNEFIESMLIPNMNCGD